MSLHENELDPGDSVRLRTILCTAASCEENENDIRCSGGKNVHLMFIKVHNWSLRGSWCCLWTEAARKTRSNKGE